MFMQVMVFSPICWFFSIALISEPAGAKPESSHIKTTTSQSAPTSEVDAKIAEAQKQFNEKHYEASIRILTPIAELLPRSGLLLLARNYAATKETLDELRTLELCIAKNPNDYVVQTVYGNALVHTKNRVEEGLVAFQEARKINPRYQPAYEALLRELEKKGERYEARNVVTDMMKVFGEKPQFFTQLCRLYALDGFHEKSVESCEQAIATDPKVPENHVYLGQALKERDEIDRAKSVLSRASLRFPASEPVQTAMGDLYMSKKDYARAYDFYKKSSAANPNAGRAWVGYANASFQLQKNQESLNAYVKACKVDRQETRDFRSAIGVLRVRRDLIWQSRFESGINECQ